MKEKSQATRTDELANYPRVWLFRYRIGGTGPRAARWPRTATAWNVKNAAGLGSPDPSIDSPAEVPSMDETHFTR